MKCNCIPKKLCGASHQSQELTYFRMEGADEEPKVVPKSRMARLLCCACRCRCLLLFSVFLLLVACIGIYITLAVCTSISSRMLHHLHRSNSILARFTHRGKFTAPGAVSGYGLAAHPRNPFWRQGMDVNKTGLWNRLQYKLDSLSSEVLQSDTAKSGKAPKPLAVSRKGPCVFSLDSMRKALPEFDGLPSHIQEFLLRMPCRDFPLLTDQPRLCKGAESKAGVNEAPLLLLAVKSQDEHYEQRQAIRETWGATGHVRGRLGPGGLVRRVFLLGRGEVRPDRTQEELLAAESKRYSDLLRWDFKDTFFNLTLKDVLFWNWLSQHCPGARFVFKGDDDVLVHTPALLDYLRDQLRRDEQRVAAGNRSDLHNLVLGDVIPLAQPIRFKDIKYYIPDSVYKGTYPTYPGGGGVVYSGALALRLRKVSERVRLFPIDDVYVGMCLERLGVVPRHEPAFLTFDFPEGEEERPCSYHGILMVHKRTPEVVRKLWEELLQPPPECQNMPLRVEPTPPPKTHKAKAAKSPPKVTPKESKADELDIMDWL